jgi:hypothetical protein
LVGMRRHEQRPHLESVGIEGLVLCHHCLGRCSLC